jgi:putative nucleotidyltransferase with HDIG domain
MPISFSISDTFTIIAALMVGPAAGAVTAALDGLVLSCLMSNNRRSAPRVLFNMAFPAVATWASAELFFAMAGPTPLAHGPVGALRLLAILAVFGIVDFALTTGTVAIAIALESRSAVLKVWREHFVGLWITYFGGIFAAMLMMAIGRVNTLEVLILIAPLPVILWVTFRHAEARAQDQIQHLGKMNKVYVAAIEALAQAVDAKDEVTHDHVRRVQANCVHVAKAMGVTDHLVIEALKAASLLHDVGKIGIPEHILNKPGRLTPSEFEIMKKHAPMGAEILSVIGFPYPVVPIVRHHHENWDGTGYPDGLSAEQIPIGARILQVVDCFDALTSDRPYRPRISDQQALEILDSRRGTMYDPHVVDVFRSLHAAGEQETQAPMAEGSERASTTARAAEPQDAGGGAVPLHTFYELGRALRPGTLPREIGETLWAHLAKHFAGTSFVFYRYEAESDALVAAFCSQAGLVGSDTRIPLGERLSGWVAASGQGIVNADARLDLHDASGTGVDMKSALAVPALMEGRAVAVLAFYSADADAFTETHQRIAEAGAFVTRATSDGTALAARLVSAA